MSDTLIVVGAGLIGSSIAYHLSLITNKKIIVLERSQDSFPAYSSKGGSRITGRALGSECAEYVSLLSVSNEIYRTLIKKGFPIFYPGDCVTVGSHGSPKIIQTLAQIKDYSVEAEHFTNKNTAKFYTDECLVTNDVADEIIVEKHSDINMLGILDPSVCVQAFQALAIKNGVEFKFDTQLVSLSKCEDQNRLEIVSNGAMEVMLAEKVVLATNANTGYLSTLKAKVWRQRMPLIFIEIEHAAFVNSYLYVNDIGAYDLFVMPEHMDGKLYLKAGIHDLELYEDVALSDEQFLQKMQGVIHDKVCEYFPFVRGKKISHTVICEYGVTKDGLPYIGEVDQGVWVAVGFNGNGAKHAGAFGLLVARLLINQKIDPMLERFAVNRGV